VHDPYIYSVLYSNKYSLSKFFPLEIYLSALLIFRLPYAEIFGGVSAMRREQFEKVNGFSNSFWGWGGEDDDMANRIKFHGLHISRYPANIAHYKMLTHKKEKASPNRSV
jgi:predicted glycosyltransferase involved in capsule biosynthesis